MNKRANTLVKVKGSQSVTGHKNEAQERKLLLFSNFAPLKFKYNQLANDYDNIILI